MNILPEYLQLISPNNPLVLDKDVKALHGAPTGWLGPGRPISPVIIRMWLDNNLLVNLNDESGRPYPFAYVLTEFGLLCAAGKVKDSELKLPKPKEFIPTFEASETPEDGTLLFSAAGTCRLCSAKMDVYGQISHAKSHIRKGDSVIIEERNRKKYPKIVGEIYKTPETVPLPVTEALERKQELDAQWRAQEHPDEPRLDPLAPFNAGGWEGRNLFSVEGICRLDQKKIHLFAHCSHAKAHIRNGDPVEILKVKGKSKPMVLEGFIPTAELTELEELSDQDASKAAINTAFDRAAGINALVTLQEAVGAEVDQEALAASWDRMAETDRSHTLKAAEIVRKSM